MVPGVRGGPNIDSDSRWRLKVTVKSETDNVLFTVVPEGCESLLGGAASKTLNLVRRVYHINCSEAIGMHSCTVDSIVQRYSDVFKGLGGLPYTYEIQLKDDAEPVIHVPRRVSDPLRQRLKRELDRRSQLQVITKVEELNGVHG